MTRRKQKSIFQAIAELRAAWKPAAQEARGAADRLGTDCCPLRTRGRAAGASSRAADSYRKADHRSYSGRHSRRLFACRNRARGQGRRGVQRASTDERQGDPARGRAAKIASSFAQCPAHFWPMPLVLSRITASSGDYAYIQSVMVFHMLRILSHLG
jgi:hypothetical protein